MHNHGIGAWAATRRRKSPDKVAIVAGDVQVTYRQFADQVDRISSVLRHRGLGRGDAVAYIGENCPEFLEVMSTEAGKTDKESGKVDKKDDKTSEAKPPADKPADKKDDKAAAAPASGDPDEPPSCTSPRDSSAGRATGSVSSWIWNASVMPTASRASQVAGRTPRSRKLVRTAS